MTYNHGEAFNLMKYQCESCKRVETLWNSRDGVTPFVIDCLKCKGMASHVNWGTDVHDENFGYQFIVGCFPSMRVFVDMTKDRAVEFATRRLLNFEGSEYPPPPRDSAEWRELLARVAEDFYHDGQAPEIITGAEYATRYAEVKP